MRSRFAYVAILALTFALLVPSAAVAAEKQISMDVAAARVAAETLLVSRGINPSDAVFQVGERNYAGSSCPGSDWNCTGASIVVQITTGAAVSSVNKADECTAEPCVITQTNNGGKNDARCMERSSANPAVQTCIITQTNTTGTNQAFVSQWIKQSQPDGSQSARQTATVSQTNDTGTNDSQISQTIDQSEASDLSGATLEQSQESHQRADVCQGGAGDPCTAASNGKNVSDVSQSNAQRLKARFSADSTGTIDQNQNTDNAGGPTNLAIVRQNSNTSTGDSGLTQSSREIASAQDGTKDGDEDNDEALSHPSPFAGTVNQQQGVTGNPTCPDSGLCGFVFQNSTGVLKAREGQDELQKLQGPPGANQMQFGPEFCCATQIGGNPKNKNDVDQNKVQLHTSSTANGLIQGHCDSAPDGCNVTQKLRQNATTQTNSCAGSFCAPSIVCQTSSGEGGEVTVCAPCPSESPLCNRDGPTFTGAMNRSVRLTVLAPVPLESSASL